MKLQNDAKRGGLGVLKDRTKALEIASRLRRMRTEAGYSQRELAKAADVNVSSVISAESAAHMPRPTTLRKLAEALDVDVSDFFDTTLISKEPPPDAETVRGGPFMPETPEEKQRRQTPEYKQWWRELWTDTLTLAHMEDDEHDIIGDLKRYVDKLKAEEKRRRETNPPPVDTVTPHEEAREEPREREPVREFSTTNLETMSTEEFEELQNLVARERARRYWVASQES